MIIKTDPECQKVSISSTDATVAYETTQSKSLDHPPGHSQRPSSLNLGQKPQRMLLRTRSKSIDNSSKRSYSVKEKSRDKLQRFREKLLQSSPDLNETSDESTPLVSEVSSPSNKSSDNKTASGSERIPLTVIEYISENSKSEKNQTSEPDPDSPNKTNSPDYKPSNLRTRTLSGDSDSSLTGFLQTIEANKEEVKASNSSLQSLSPGSGHLSRQDALDSEENLTDAYCNPGRIN